MAEFLSNFACSMMPLLRWPNENLPLKHGRRHCFVDLEFGQVCSLILSFSHLFGFSIG